MKHFWVVLIVVSIIACQSHGQGNVKALTKKTSASTFNSYWYAGEGELNSYELKQIRYGEVHDGEVVLIFVTEDFSKSKQVKLDNPERVGKDATKVLKLNQVREFNTGIYSYNMMSSVFTPVQGDRSLKVTTSSQDWCGHAFAQLNLQESYYAYQNKSYFESEGDTEGSLPIVLLEDELFNMIRLRPEQLMQGNMEIIPSTIFSRLRHIPLKKEKAVGKLINNEDNSLTYNVRYTSIERILSITFENSFPFKILAWEEQHKSGYGSNAKTLTTKATLKKTLKLPYWEKHRTEDKSLRKQLSLDF